MYTKKPFTELLKKMMFVWLILFSFAPCTTKDFFADALDISFQKPLNKNKATTLSTICGTAFETTQVSIQHQKNSRKEIVLNEKNVQKNNRSAISFSENPNYISAGNSPPKYILYKRWKLHLI